MKKSKLIIYLVVVFAMFIGAFGAGYYYNYSVNSKAVMTKANAMINKKKVVVKKEKRPDATTGKTNSEGDDNKVVDGPITKNEIFLTIDDGPAMTNTPKLIDILNQNGVKATFFIIGKNAERSPGMLKKLDDNGMCVLAHSYTHDYKIYQSIQTYMADLDKCNEIIKSSLGKDPLPFTRFPGGSDNRVSNQQTMRSIREAVKARGIYYVDWNVSSADSAPGLVRVDQIENNILSQSKGKMLVVSLMHDSPEKKTTVEALPAVIKGLKQQGFVFRTFKDITPTEIKEMEKLRIIYR